MGGFFIRLIRQAIRIIRQKWANPLDSLDKTILPPLGKW